MKFPYIEVIENTIPNPNLLMWKFDDEDKEIQNGAKLTVRESQVAVFLNEGKMADVFQPGMHTLKTENIPILTQMKGWKHGFQSPFKSDVYFVSTRQFVNNKWGTATPIMMRDPEFGQVRVRAFGTFDFKITDFQTFFSHYAATYPTFYVTELQYELRDIIAPSFGEVLAKENISVKDIASNYSEIGSKIKSKIAPYFRQFGIELTTFSISSVTLPDEVSAHYDQITNMNMIDDMEKFKEFNTAKAIGTEGKALNEATVNAMSMGMMMNELNKAKPEKQEDDIASKLKKLKTLYEQDLIDEEEYKEKKSELLDKL